MRPGRQLNAETSMFTGFLKRNSILLIYAASAVLLISLVLLEIDMRYYQVDKSGIIQNNIQTYVDQQVGKEQIDKLGNLALENLQNPSMQTGNLLRELIWKVVSGPNIVYRIAIKSDKPNRSPKGREVELSQIDIQSTQKFKDFNRFSNSLFLRNFSKTNTGLLVDSMGNQRGRLILYYTSPKDDPKIQELTTRYRWISAFILLILVVLASIIARRLLIPLRNIMNSIESSHAERTYFILRPHAHAENLYNRMALDAVLARLQGQLRDEIARLPQMTSWEVVEFVCHAFSRQIGLPLVGCLELLAEGPGRIRPTGQRILAGSGRWPGATDELMELLDQLVPRDGRDRERFSLPEYAPPVEGLLEMVSDSERTGIRYLFALGLDARASESAFVSLPYLAGRLNELVDAGLQTLSLRNQLLVQERGRANISLSRNLGHDLTNIIATSKLELMALDRLLGDGAMPEDPRRRMILAESLHGLLRSVRFMQETVNLYRAYAFLQHPVLETHEGNTLVAQTLDLFAMSIAAKVTLHRELADDAPRCVVDSRLIKLALFNLFANALEAIRKTDPDRSVRGWIRVVTRRSTEGGLCIAVDDSGTGILNGAGQRAESHEIEKIFELGYTSRRTSGNQGEGLGLNWVRTIVQDLHGGSIFAENIPDGGARFILIFPPLEAAPRQGPVTNESEHE